MFVIKKDLKKYIECFKVADRLLALEKIVNLTYCNIHIHTINGIAINNILSYNERV
ncbi:hypothetical protein [Sporanaerobacter acetigenes]|uniref:hypothetical protein n=1 Tax=Sporanaerobacter acetigenes TaxID=165813 RepID=UPI00135655F0|nr:hypothetical protein [Sporanaerobacter acetigenes]